MESGRKWQGIYLTRPDLAVTVVWEVFFWKDLCAGSYSFR